MISKPSPTVCYDKSYMEKIYEFNTLSKDKVVVFQQAARILLSRGFKLIDIDITKPWGFYLSVDESQTPDFIKEFYDGAELKEVDTSLPLRPKFLGIAPNQRLSWQYHHRRSEVWRTLAGEYQLVTSATDTEQTRQNVKKGDVVAIPQGRRHRGVGLNEWALIAEIWQHTDHSNPSSEEDIVRVQDDFGRQ
jgi:mannose-6-phosphate isomerase-like protein (cupin superfamily)